MTPALGSGLASAPKMGAMPAMSPIPSLPPLQMASSATSRGGDAAFSNSKGGISQGDWIISNGSGDATGGAPKGMMLAAVGLAALWILKRKA